MDLRNEVKSYIVREGMTMCGLLERLSASRGWSRSRSNFSGKLKRGTIRYAEVKDIADELGFDIIWVKRSEKIYETDKV